MIMSGRLITSSGIIHLISTIISMLIPMTAPDILPLMRNMTTYLAGFMDDALKPSMFLVTLPVYLNYSPAEWVSLYGGLNYSYVYSYQKTQQSDLHYPLFIIHYSLFIIHYSLFIIHYYSALCSGAYQIKLPYAIFILTITTFQYF